MSDVLGLLSEPIEPQGNSHEEKETIEDKIKRMLDDDSDEFDQSIPGDSDQDRDIPEDDIDDPIDEDLDQEIPGDHFEEDQDPDLEEEEIDWEFEEMLVDLTIESIDELLLVLTELLTNQDYSHLVTEKSRSKITRLVIALRKKKKKKGKTGVSILAIVLSAYTPLILAVMTDMAKKKKGESVNRERPPNQPGANGSAAADFHDIEFEEID